MKRKKTPKPKESTSFLPPEIRQIEELLDFMTEHNLEEFEYSRGELRIRLRKPSLGAPQGPIRFTSDSGGIKGGGSASEASEGSAGAYEGHEVRGGEDLHLVKSPIVGTFYGAPSPGAEPFVSVGSNVETGQTLCIVEAMKLMNEIESDASGEVVKIFADNGQPVEYGQPLFGIRQSKKK